MSRIGENNVGVYMYIYQSKVFNRDNGIVHFALPVLFKLISHKSFTMVSDHPYL